MSTREIRANRILSRNCLICIAPISLILLCNEIGIFILNKGIMRIAWLLVVTLLFIPAVFVFILKIERPWVKYICLLTSVLIVGILYALLAYHVLLLFILPILFALYYPKRSTLRRVWMLENFVLIVSHIYELNTKYVVESPLISLRSMILFGIIPRLLELYCMYLVANEIAVNTDQYIAEKAIEQREREIMQQEMIFKFADVCEREDKDTGMHSKRVCEYMKVMLREAGYGKEEVYLYSLASALHDIGKIEVPKEILSKPGKLTPEEFEEVKRHVPVAEELLKDAHAEVLQIAHDIAKEHHERYDGKGYLGLKPEETNYYSRLFAIVDVWDALVSERCYKKAWEPEKVYDQILAESGTHFDPQAVEVFKKSYPEMLRLKREFDVK